jgi:hypothetical protein
MVLLVTSASGANGAGYGKVLAYSEDGELLGSSITRGLGTNGTLLFSTVGRTGFWRSTARVVWCARAARSAG